MDTNEPNELINAPNSNQTSATFAYPNLKAVIRLFFVLLFYMIVGLIILSFFLHEVQRPSSQLLRSFLNLLFYVFALLLTIRYASKKIKRQQKSSFNISFNRVQAWLVPVVIISTLALVVGLQGISNLIPMPPSVQKFFAMAFKKDAFSVANIAIAAPVLEEILFRGMVLKGLLKNYAPLKAILISAIFFSLIHLNPWQAFPAFFGGLFLGWVFYKTRSIIPGMIIHATINTTGVMFMFLPKNQQGFLNLLGMPYYIILCVFSALTFVLGCVVIHKKYPNNIYQNSEDNLINDVVVK
ncbi:MAG: type II CAAX endopeptidase family protein [Mucilaginibacter sp.]|uniref:CPBP family intramembrane glutamic endopeptidase n=1 Tax=Mucilaginibacter sp. TaxID=1882438 RepID=UPI0031B433AC